MTEYTTRVVAMVVVPKDEPLFSETATRIEIVDEADGEYVMVSQQGVHTDMAKALAFNPDEWVVVRGAIDSMIAECREG